VLNAETMLALHVTDDTTKALAAQYGVAANAYIKSVTKLFDEPTEPGGVGVIEAAYKVHRFLTGLRSKFTGTAQGVVDHCRREIADYDIRVEQARLSLQRKLQAEEDLKARLKADEERTARLAELQQAKEDAERKAQEALDDAMPWDQPPALLTTQVADIQRKLEDLATAPVTYVAPQIIVPEPPKVEGAGSRNTPLKFRLKGDGLDTLIVAAAANPALRQYLKLDEDMVKARMKTLGDKLGEFIPGVETYRDKTVSFR
jgi:hypothetical protein